MRLLSSNDLGTRIFCSTLEPNAEKYGTKNFIMNQFYIAVWGHYMWSLKSKQFWIFGLFMLIRLQPSIIVQHYDGYRLNNGDTSFSLHEKCPYSELLWSKCGEIRTRITPNTDNFYAGCCLKVGYWCFINKELCYHFHLQVIEDSPLLSFG